MRTRIVAGARGVRKYVHQLIGVVADFLAPRVCARCERPGAWLCAACIPLLDGEPNVTCVGCGRVSSRGETCVRCRPLRHLAGVLALIRYRDSTIQRVIHAVKYAPAMDVAGAYDVLLSRFLDADGRALLRGTVGDMPLLVPVPLHWRRESMRGFNQSHRMVETLVGAGVGDMGDVLVRRRSTLPQVSLPIADRYENVAAAFECANAAAVHQRSVLLVDDVVTTGATMNACARVLRDAGAARVWGFAIARG